MSARDRILQRLRSVRVSLPPADAAPLQPWAGASVDACIERFAVEATGLGVACFIESTADAARRRLAELTRGRRVLTWDAPHLPYDAAAVIETPAYGRDTRDRQAAAEVGVTGCDAAIAETGSLVFFSAPGRSRTVSLLPPVHVALVERRSICFTMAEMFERHAARFHDSASCTIITGPSRTADIELTLTLGIHGPREVVIVIGP